MFFGVDIRQYINEFRGKRFAQSVLYYWSNRTALPPDFEEAVIILRISGDNWDSVVTAPFLQFYASVDGLTPGCTYKIQFSIGLHRSEHISSALRSFGVPLVRTHSRGKSRGRLLSSVNIGTSSYRQGGNLCTAQRYVGCEMGGFQSCNE